jgi:hypothetical protein
LRTFSLRPMSTDRTDALDALPARGTEPDRSRVRRSSVVGQWDRCLGRRPR